MVFAYGGSMIFPEFVGDSIQPVLVLLNRKRWPKCVVLWTSGRSVNRPSVEDPGLRTVQGMACAQALIFTAYMLFGVFVYAFQGQYTVRRLEDASTS